MSSEEPLLLAYLAVPRFEHYDVSVKTAGTTQTETKTDSQKDASEVPHSESPSKQFKDSRPVITRKLTSQTKRSKK